MVINGVEMITDRTASDVEIAKSLVKKGLQNMTNEEKQAFLSGLKGAYNYTDLNRVESAVQYMFGRLTALPKDLRTLAGVLGVAWDELFDVPYEVKDYTSITTVTDWDVYDVVDTANRSRYLQNLQTIANAVGKDADKIPREWEGIKYSDANNIEIMLEKSLAFIDDLQSKKINLIESTHKNWIYSGEAYGGEI